MTATFPATIATPRASAGRQRGVSSRRGRARRPRGHRPRTARDHSLLGQYTDRDGRSRELVARAGAGDSTLVIDRDRATHDDPRLVAHIAADEPAENAAVVCERYLQDASCGRCRCRALSAEDMTHAPFADPWDPDGELASPASGARAVDRDGRSYALELVPGQMSIPELRWRRQEHRPAFAAATVSMREALAALESYEPVRALTLHGLARHRHDELVSTTVLRAELARTQASPIVLNRALREAVVREVERGGLTMSEIAIRCGRIKRDRRGNEAGETSWLARRLGLRPEGGHSAPTPWIHSDVLALIARRGLGISPREVEL